MDRAAAFAYLSAASDFQVSQVVDGTKGVHGMIRKSDFISVTSKQRQAVPDGPANQSRAMAATRWVSTSTYRSAPTSKTTLLILPPAKANLGR